MTQAEASPALYTPAWLETQAYTKPWVERALLAVFAQFGLPGAMLDLGCGTGYAVRLAQKLGVMADGIDIALQPYGDVFLSAGDLTKPLPPANWLRDLVLCWETAEHIAPAGTKVFLDNVVTATDKLLIFTAARPGQGGEGHINCRSKGYWRRELERRGLVYQPDETKHLRETWRWCTGPAFWYPANVQVFRRP